MTTHSPLPWTRHVSIGSWFVQDADGETVVIFDRDKTVYSEPEPGVRQTRTVPLPHADANCQLFFAAPQMLTALKRYLSVYASKDEDPSPLERAQCMAAIFAAVAEAETVKDGTVAAAEHQAERDKAINDAFLAETPKV